MKRVLMAIIAAVAVVCEVGAADAVEPASVTVTNFRSEAQSYASSEYFYEGTTLLFTNCVTYAGADTNSAVQGLDSVTIAIDIGTTTTNTSYAGTAQVASNGTWWASVAVPSNLPTVYMQLKLTDSSTNSYIYPWKMIKTKEAL